MKLTKKLMFGFGFTTIAIAAPVATVISCGVNHPKTVAVKVADYNELIHKLGTDEITMISAFAQAKELFAGEEFDNILGVGATEYIANDGIQARPSMKRDDIDIIQSIFFKLIHETKTNPKYTYHFSDGKKKTLFSLFNQEFFNKLEYNHDDRIKINIENDKKPAYSRKPDIGMELFELNHNSKYGYVTKKGVTLKIQIADTISMDKLSHTADLIKKGLHDDGINVEFLFGGYGISSVNLVKNSVDLAFLPSGIWGSEAPTAPFILQTARKAQIIDPYEVDTSRRPALPRSTIPAISTDYGKEESDLVHAFNHYRTFNKNSNNTSELFIGSNAKTIPADSSMYSARLKKSVDKIVDYGIGYSGFYRGFIMTRNDSQIYKMIKDAMIASPKGSIWKLDWNKAKPHIRFGFVSTSSSASFIYPQQWFRKHFNGFDSFARS